MTRSLGSRNNILITGSEGFIGSNLEIAGDEWDISRGKDVFAYTFDNAVKKTDVVIHLAAATSVNGSFKNPEQHFKINTLGTARVAYLCQKYEKKLIFPSTGAVQYPDLSPYAKSKYLADEIVQGIMNTTPVTILRFFNVFGPNMNPDSGSIMYNFQTEDDIVVYGDGEQTRDFIHVNDVADIVKSSIAKKWDGKIVEVGTGQSYTINYVAGMFAHFRSKKVIYHDAPKREIKWSIADTSVLRTLYKKPFKTNLERNIRELCQN